MAVRRFSQGNGVLPRVAMDGNIVMVIYDIRERRPGHADFTQLFCPAEVFDDFRLVPASEAGGEDGHWLFARSGQGVVGIWACSELIPFTPRASEVATWRQAGDRSAWCVVAGELGHTPDTGRMSAESAFNTFDAFIARCLDRRPVFCKEKFCLSITNDGDDGNDEGAVISLSMDGPLLINGTRSIDTPVNTEPFLSTDRVNWVHWSSMNL